MKHLFIDGEYIGSRHFGFIKSWAIENKLNGIVSRSNGYSHDWEEVVLFTDEFLHSSSSVYLTSRPIGRVMGSSSVSFS